MKVSEKCERITVLAKHLEEVYEFLSVVCLSCDKARANLL